MERYTIQQRVEIVKIYYTNLCSVRQTFRQLRNNYGRNDRPTERTIQRIIAKFEESGSVTDRAVPVRRRNARSVENIVAVTESVREDPDLSIPRRSQGVGLSATSTWRIMRKDLGLFPYKIQLAQELKPEDHESRRTFADWVLEQLETDPHFGEKIIFSDEAHFWMNGFVNKQNCRIWGASNPHQYQESILYPEKLTVWCGRHWAIRLPQRKRSGGDCEWCTIQINDNKFFLAQIGRYGLGKHVVPTRRCDKPHSCRKS